MKKQFFLLAALAISAFTFAQNKTCTWNASIAEEAGIPKGSYKPFNGVEGTITLDNVIYIVQDIMRNNNNSPTGYATNQLLQIKKASGHFMNKNSMTLVSLVLIMNSEAVFEVSAGTSADELSVISMTAADETIQLTTYSGGAAGDPADVTYRKATIDLTGKNFVKVAGLDGGTGSPTPFLYSAVLTYTGSGGEATHVASVELDADQHEVKLAAFETIQLNATVKPDNADDPSLTWSSSNEDVAVVSDKGLVTALAKGTANIVVKSVDGEKTDTCKLTVEDAKPSDFVVIATDQLKDKDTVIITMTIDSVGTPMLLDAEGATGTPGPKAATGGFINGSIVPAKDNFIFVAHVSESGITFIPKGHEPEEEIMLYVGGTANDGVRVKKLTYKTEAGLDSVGHIWTVETIDGKYSYLKSSYLTNDGEVTRYLGLYDGYFKAYKKNAKGELSSNIKEQHLAFFVKGATLVHPESVELDKHEAKLKVGESLQLAATVKPDDALNKNVDWKSLNPAIATVDENGRVTAVAEGSTSIVVITEDAEKTDTCKLVIEKPAVPVTGVTLDKTNEELKVGATLQLTATVAPENADVKDVEWSTSDAKIATVSATGLVTAVAKGEATITVTTKDGGKTATCKVKVVEEEQGIENLIANPELNGKIMHQGQLYIIRDGKMYNVTGARVQ